MAYLHILVKNTKTYKCQRKLISVLRLFTYQNIDVIIHTNSLTQTSNQQVTAIRSDQELLDSHPSDHHHHQNHDMVTIGGVNIHIMKLSGDKFACHYLPYWSYSSLEDLSKDLIDIIPRFNRKLIRDEGV